MTSASTDQINLLDLRTGRTVWELNIDPPSPSAPLTQSVVTDVIVVGAGITGAFIAERMSRTGRAVTVLDRHAPQQASTAASTSLLQWEIDAPMLELEDRLGFDTAAAIYRRSVTTVQELGVLVGALGNACEFAWRHTLFLAGDELDPADLRQEHALRARAGIVGTFLSADALHKGFGLHRDAALFYSGSAEANPMRLAAMLLGRAIQQGAQVVSPALVTDYDCGSQGVTVRTSDGFDVSGELLILANGYEMPAFVPASKHKVASTWAIATTPQSPDALWPDRALIWEASDPYCYLRTTPERRIIIGGEDEHLHDAAARDELIPAKTRILQQKLGLLLPHATLEMDAAWTGFFGETDDGLPLLGRVPGMPQCFAAFGYGGNGITFSAMAADILAHLIAGGADPAEEWFAIDR